MKILFTQLLFLFGCFAVVAAQQGSEPKPSTVQPAAEALVKSQSPVSQLQDKSDGGEVKKDANRKAGKAAFPLGAPFVVIDGAVYIRAGETIIPMNGGGASGCFATDPAETAVKVEKAKAKFAEQSKTEQNKKD